MTRVERLSKEVKAHDRDLFCMLERGTVLVCRRNTVWEDFHFLGSRFLYSRQIPQVVMAVTDTYSQKGKPIDLGIEPLIHRLKQIDLWGDFNDSKNVVKNLEAVGEQTEKENRTRFEAMAYEMRNPIKKMFGDVNTSQLKKLDKRRI